jgi:sulfate adenylyltransferase large subunit
MAIELAPLRCATAGSVDDGKSTLIGRLLLDSKALLSDQVAHVAEVSRRRGLERTDLALVTDGLRAEREQGITIDVAWRYFATPRRRFVLADAPGHVQYTRNMVTACSLADVATILLDVRRGVTEQTRRHVFLTRLLGVRSLVFTVNKMDEVGFAHDAFARLRDEITRYLEAFKSTRRDVEVFFVPISALAGDNVVEPSRKMPWYDGPTLLALLEGLPVDRASAVGPARMPVQWVIRTPSGASGSYRGYAGRVTAGTLRVGQTLRCLPAGGETCIQRIDTSEGETSEARAGQSVVLYLTDELDVSRGDMLVGADDAPPWVTQDLVAEVAWVSSATARVGASYIVKHTTREARAILDGIEARYDITSGAEEPPGDTAFGLNTLGRVRLRTSSPLAIDSYRDFRATGSFLLIDPTSSETLAAGLVDRAIAP